MTSAAVTPASGWKGLAEHTIRSRNITRCRGIVELPYYAKGQKQGNSPYNVRSIIEENGRRFWRHSGLPVVPYGVESLGPHPFPTVPLVWTEGESDCLAFLEAFGCLHYRALGVPGAATWKSEWVAHALGHFPIYVIPDGDAAGASFATKVLRDLPAARVVRMPEGLDARRLLQTEGAGAMQLLLEAADAEAAEQEWLRGVDEAVRFSKSLEECRARLRGEMRDAA